MSVSWAKSNLKLISNYVTVKICLLCAYLACLYSIGAGRTQKSAALRFRWDGNHRLLRNGLKSLACVLALFIQISSEAAVR